MTTTKAKIIEMLRERPRTRAELLEEFPEAAQARGAGSVITWMLRHGQAEETNDGLIALMNAGAESAACAPRRRQADPQDPPEEIGDEAESELLWALWSDGDLTLRRGDESIVLTSDERDRLLEWLRNVGDAA